MKHFLTTTCATLLLVTAHANAEPIKLLGSDDFTWETTPEGVAFAALQGDRFAEPYQALVKLPSGTTSPPHVKSANMYGVMLQGEMVHFVDGDNPDDARKIGPGSFYSIERGTPHVSACISDSQCIVYLYQDGAFDFLAVRP